MMSSSLNISISSHLIETPVQQAEKVTSSRGAHVVRGELYSTDVTRCTAILKTTETLCYYNRGTSTTVPKCGEGMLRE